MPTLYWGPWLAKICRGGPASKSSQLQIANYFLTTLVACPQAYLLTKNNPAKMFFFTF